MWTIIKFFLKNKQVFHILKKYFKFVREGYTFKMDRMINLFLMLAPKCKKIKHEPLKV